VAGLVSRPVFVSTGRTLTGGDPAIGFVGMPIRSPGDAPGGTIRDLGLPGRAVTALARAGIASIDDLAALTRRDLAGINGLGRGMIAAIRLVVPEPPTSVPGAGASARADHENFRAIDPESEPGEEESPAAPTIPSFDSLRAPRRRSAVDLLVPTALPAASPTRAPSAGAPRPAEYADVLRLGLRLVRAAADVPGRAVRCLRRLLGE
jgi:hypothetical protein